MRPLRAFWVVAPLLVGAGLLLFALSGGFGPDVPEPAPLGALPASTLSVRVAYDLTGLAYDLETELPTRFGDLGSRQRYPGDERLAYAFEAERGPLTLTSAGDTVRVATELQYAGQVWYATPLGIELTTACGIADGGLMATAPRARVELSFPLAVDESWALRSAPTVDNVEPASESDRCRAAVLQFEVDATDAIISGLRAWLTDEVGRMGSRMGDLSTRPYAEQWWAAAGDPIEVANGVWLMLDPQSLSYRIGGPDELAANASGASYAPPAPGAAPGSITGEIAATVRPRIVLGPRPPAAPRLLPPLTATLPASEEAEPDWIAVEALLGFAEASDWIESALEGAEWRGLGLTVRVASAELSPETDGRAALALDLEGSHPASIRLLGTPVLDPETGEVTVPDLDVALQSGGGVPRVVVWAASTALRGFGRERARWPVESLLSGALDRTLQVRLSADATLDGSLEEVELSSLAATGEGIVLRARVRPETTLRVGFESL